jgi:hypothetical protein
VRMVGAKYSPAYEGDRVRLTITTVYESEKSEKSKIAIED